MFIVENFRVDSWTVCFHKALVNSTVFEGKRRIVYEVCETDDVLQVLFFYLFSKSYLLFSAMTLLVKNGE
jgi:hypothetical protein